ncbi:unnamed protein product [Caenorhabditis angaria]|uniref:Uncharacterized protein n=1 Tax=Caenorhabditis angaria TaxID=860376 RepID=A0A9P1IXH3_9PELO|nr:unnamed protein product [Caenorhabditis angaria]
MIPEFPLPPTDADFYKSQIYQLPPMFGHSVTVPKLVESSSIFSSNSIENRIDMNQAVKSAKVSHNIRSNLFNSKSSMTKNNSNIITTSNLFSKLIPKLATL